MACRSYVEFFYSREGKVKIEQINLLNLSAPVGHLTASFIFAHDSIASLLRELNRNSQLRIICGFQPHIYSVLTDKRDEYGKRISESRYKLAPTASAYTNFLNNLKECEDELREMFDTLVKYMYKNLNGFGKIIAADGKAIQSYIRRISEKNSGNEERGMSTSVKKIHNN